MYNSCKYIVVATEEGIYEKLIVFDGSLLHKTMANAMEAKFPKVVSAGFVDEFFQCYGESMSVGRKSREIDTLLLKTMLNIEDKKIIFEDERIEESEANSKLKLKELINDHYEDYEATIYPSDSLVGTHERIYKFIIDNWDTIAYLKE